MSNKPRIMIDSGHGGEDSGAVGPMGLQEKAVTLSVGMLLGAILKGDCDIVHTRRDDTFIPLARRATLANDWQANAFISIHCNAGPPGHGTGFEVFTTIGQTQSDRLATEAFTAFGAEFPGSARRMDMRDGDPDKEADFAVLRLTHCPAILFELEFIHTVAGEAWLRDVKNHARCAKALAAAVRKFFGLADRTETADRADPLPLPLNVRIREASANLQSLVSQLP
jgi:N-acetylmuramoyl-L-alanine amidase